MLNLYKLGKLSLNETLDEIIKDKNQESMDIDRKKEINESKKNLENIIKELDSLIGLKNVKSLVKEIQAFVEIQEKRKEANLLTDPVVLHMIFKGSPGTGKTTVARLIGKILKEMGVLEKGHIVEVERADIVGEYIGHTAVKVKQQIKKALGGILFIDEAYSLARGGEKDFGKEAIDALVKAMEDNKDNLVLILAGYNDEMENFLKINPGLKSRFPIHVEFRDYSINELINIAEEMANKKEYKLTDKAIHKLETILEAKNNHKNIGNARFVRNMVERSIRKQAVRLQGKSSLNRDDLIFIKEEDIEGDDIY
ncbi:stage V sporulation protein K [Gottschalkia purinilytica]|uniref:Stage V sporulation protein K n=1 Tax=Gottschalkia purinilytica TaxID=1503 RepID=A0A0L0WBL4_GOTPU|nr:stage V sporulation protein K [Gottschalkia purinilytica]